MSRLSYQINIDAGQEKVWKVLADFGGVYKYSPGVSSSHSTSSDKGGVGASRHCDLSPTGSIEERIIEWNEGQSYSLEIYDGKGVPPFKKSVATLAIAPNGHGTVVTATLDYSLKYGPLGALMEALVVKRFLQRGFQALLAGLKHHVETGEEVQSAKGLPFKLVAVPA